MADSAAQTDFVKRPAYPRLATNARESKPVKPMSAPMRPKAPKRMDPMMVARMLKIRGKAPKVTPGTAF